MIFIDVISVSTLYLYIMEEKYEYPWNWTKYPISLEVKWKVSYIPGSNPYTSLTLVVNTCLNRNAAWLT